MSQKLLPFFLSGLILLGLCIPNHLHAAEPASDGDVVIVVVHQQYGQNTGGPRTPNATRIEAWYSYDTSSVSATLSNAGDVVEVEFSHLLSGETHFYEIPGNGLSVMPIGGNPGYWAVSFTLSSGVVYIGLFVL
jgi:hypothetical protein